MLSKIPVIVIICILFHSRSKFVVDPELLHSETLYEVGAFTAETRLIWDNCCVMVVVPMVSNKLTLSIQYISFPSIPTFDVDHKSIKF